jgi:hypothetical protein
MIEGGKRDCRGEERGEERRWNEGGIREERRRSEGTRGYERPREERGTNEGVTRSYEGSTGRESREG